MTRAAVTQSCPSESALEAFRMGKLEGTERSAVEAHVAHCSECANRTTDALAQTLMATSQPSATPRFLDGSEDPGLERLIALKILRTDASRGTAGEELRQRLLREARAMARLSHPNVVTVYDAGTFGDQLFI